MSQDKLYTGGKIESGHYIQPKLYLVPETVTTEVTDKDAQGNSIKSNRVHTQLHRRWKGAGRFKSGTFYAPGGKVALTDDKLPITFMADIRIGKAPKQVQSDSLTKSVD